MGGAGTGGCEESSRLWTLHTAAEQLLTDDCVVWTVTVTQSSVGEKKCTPAKRKQRRWVGEVGCVLHNSPEALPCTELALGWGSAAARKFSV